MRLTTFTDYSLRVLMHVATVPEGRATIGEEMLHHIETGEALHLLGSGLFLGNIALLGQIYHLPGDPPDAILLWLIGIAAAAHQGWSANIFTLTSDMFPKQAVGSVVGIGGMFGAIGGMVIAPTVGYILQTTNSYVPIFIIAASAYLVALLIIHLLAPKLEPATIKYD